MSPLRRLRARPLLLALAALVCTSASPRAEPQADPLSSLQLTYEGAFRVPRELDERATFDYGGTALSFDEARRSLWLVGHDHHQLVAEISIPEIRRGAALGQLATAELLTPFRDILQGRRPLVGDNTSKIGGLLRDGRDWIVSVFLYYDGAGVQTMSHFRVDRSDRVSGPFQLGDQSGQAGFVAGYMTDVPLEWRSQLGAPALTGLCCVSVISRSSLGPAVSAFDPRHVGTQAPVPAAALLGYPGGHPTLGEWSSNSPLFNGNAQVGGLVFPPGTGRVLFFGRIGLGPFCYGTGTSVPELHGRPVPGTGTTYCYDPDVSWQGTHGYPYALHAWVYDAADLAAVRRGDKNHWEIRPLTAATFSLPFEDGQKLVGGAAYDPATQRIFLSVLVQDDARPIIHVLRLASASPIDPGTSPPPPPPPPPAPEAPGDRSRRTNEPTIGRAVPR